MDNTTITMITDFVKNNTMTLTVIVLVVWSSLFVLGLVFRLVVGLIGWIGYYVVAAIPGTVTYYVTHHFFGHATDQATGQAIVTALLIGLIGSLTGLSGSSE